MSDLLPRLTIVRKHPKNLFPTQFLLQHCEVQTISKEGAKHMMKSSSPLKNTTNLVPALSTERAAQRILGFLRHPRSLVRINPSWSAPEVQMEPTSGTHSDSGLRTTVKAYRRRVSPAAWRRITGEDPSATPSSPCTAANPIPKATELYMVTLHANVQGEPVEVDREVRNSTAKIHSLFRLVCGDAPHGIVAIAEAQQDGSRCWTWHVLLTGDQIRQRDHMLANPSHPRAA